MSDDSVLGGVTAGKYRDQGYTVAFFGGRVHIWKPGSPAMGQPIDRGWWMERPNGWEAEGKEVLERMQNIRANCYCGCGVRACDFCQGIRSVCCFPA